MSNSLALACVFAHSSNETNVLRCVSRGVSRAVSTSEHIYMHYVSVVSTRGYIHVLDAIDKCIKNGNQNELQLLGKIARRDMDEESYTEFYEELEVYDDTSAQLMLLDIFKR